MIWRDTWAGFAAAQELRRPENSRHSPVLLDGGILCDVRSIRSHNKRSCQLSTSAWWREVNIVQCGLMSLELHRFRHHDRFLDLGEKSWWLADKIEDDPRVCLPPSAAMDRDQLTGSLWSPQRSTHPARRFYMLRYVTCDQVTAPFVCQSIALLDWIGGMLKKVSFTDNL